MFIKRTKGKWNFWVCMFWDYVSFCKKCQVDNAWKMVRNLTHVESDALWFLDPIYPYDNAAGNNSEIDPDVELENNLKQI